MMLNYQGAINDFDNALKTDPKYWNAYGYRAGVYFMMKKYKEAISDYKFVIEKQPLMYVNYNNISEVLIMHGDLRKASTYINLLLGRCKEARDLIIAQYLSYVINQLRKIDSNSEEENINQLSAELKSKNQKINWDFGEFKNWLELEKINPIIKSSIIKKTLLLEELK
jgi:tetratricopeptide (TPR) repeat protein